MKKLNSFLSRSMVTALSVYSLTMPVQAGAEGGVLTFPLSDVRLLDSPFKEAMDLNATYLLSLEPDRLLHNTRKVAGLEPKGDLYGGWEKQGIAGHTLGHYLTALSQQYAATGDQRFRERIDYIVAEMAECQKIYGDGYIGALPPNELATMRAFKDGKVEPSSAFKFKSGAWVPWYTEHKILAGLKDAWVLGGNVQAKEVTLKLADWVDAITAGLTPDQQQKMLQVEHGGMIEVLVEIYALTGEKKYLETSKRFYHRAILDPLLAGKDELSGVHANTQIPKIIGEARTYEITGDIKGRKISEFFWDTVVHDRSWVIGGNSDSEHFFQKGKAEEHLGPATAETCNTYNMLKLSEHLFSWDPKTEYADFYERGLYNQILASQEPKEGMFAYFISLKPGHFKTYSTPNDSFWCCVGSGMENHTKYGEFIYAHQGDNLYVNLFIPSVLTWKEKGLVLEQRNEYPQKNSIELTIQSAPVTPLNFRVRCSAWATGPLVVELNGQPFHVTSVPGQYTEISRTWKNDDHLKVTIPMGLSTETLEGNPNKVAFLYGPLVLAGDLGQVPETKTFPYAGVQSDNFRAPTADVPLLVRSGNGDLKSLVKRLPGEKLAFQTEGLGRPAEVLLRPFNEIPYDYYNIYWDVVSEKDWEARESLLKTASEKEKQDDARTVDELNPGEQQSEIDHLMISDKSKTGDFKDRKWRSAEDGGFFEFQLKVIPDLPMLLRCSYWGGDSGRREFDILINGKLLLTQKLQRDQPEKFIEVDTLIPADWISGQDKVTVRFKPHAGNIAGGLFRASILKSSP